MTKDSKTFDEFYSLKNNKICSIDEVINYSELINRNIEPYDQDMYCPECKKAKLTFVRKTKKKRAYLRKTPSSNHESGCSYNYEYVSNKTIYTIVHSMSNAEIDDRLSAMMNMLCKDTSAKNQSSNNEAIKSKNPMLIRRNTGKVIKTKAIPRKSLNCWVDQNENIYAYYGKQVKLKVVEKHKKSDGSIFYLLEIRTKNTNGEWNLKATIYRYKKPLDIDENVLYNIAFIGFFDQEYKFSIRLLNWNAIKYEIV